MAENLVKVNIKHTNNTMDHKLSPPIKVLVVDDENSIRHSLAGFLEDDGFDVTVAVNAEEALQLIAQQHFDIAVVDLRLPGMSGDIMIQHAFKLSPLLKFLIHTGSVNYSPSEELLAIGMKQQDVFQKPVLDLSIISSAIRQLTKS